jgi:DNA adenine methylase
VCRRRSAAARNRPNAYRGEGREEQSRTKDIWKQNPVTGWTELANSGRIQPTGGKHSEDNNLVLTSTPIVVPFLKWAGGKRWLTSRYAHLLPIEFDRYIEPFLGGGAVFFHLRPHTAILADTNNDLINLYSQIQGNWKKVHDALRRHDRNHSSEYYYLERARKHRSAHERAAQFLYLNRTCWNGLYRVNLRGEFNVPIGTKDAVLLDSDQFEKSASILKAATLAASDFEPIIKSATANDFLFLDPPYVTRHNFNGFLKYNDKIFSWQDQIRLANAVYAAADRGVKILMTNADHNSVRQLYRGVGRQHTLDRNSVLAADSENRGDVTEIAIAINYG